MPQLDVAGLLLRGGQKAGGIEGQLQLGRSAYEKSSDWLVEVLVRVANAQHHLVVLERV